jgi:hypothetical protein
MGLGALLFLAFLLYLSFGIFSVELSLPSMLLAANIAIIQDIKERIDSKYNYSPNFSF